LKHRYFLLYGLLLLALLGTIFAGLSLGSVELSLSQIIEGLRTQSGVGGVIVAQLRLPRVLGAALAGAALAAAGLILQCVTGNGLCAPNIVGVNAGAGFCVMLMLCFTPFAWRLLPLGAFLGALAATALVMGVAFSGRHKHAATTLVLAGVAVSSLLTAGISFLSLRFPDVLSSYTAFSVGGFAGINLSQLSAPGAIVVAALLFAQLLAPRMTLLCLGDEIASSLGVRVNALRILALVIASALCAASVSFAGLLGFVGLVVPHIVRRLAGNDMRFNLSLCVLCGSVLVVCSDLIGRIAFAPSELPAGIIMSMLGAPFFLYLLIVRRRGNDRM